MAISEYELYGVTPCPECDSTERVPCGYCGGWGTPLGAGGECRAISPRCYFCEGAGDMPCPVCQPERARLWRETR